MELVVNAVMVRSVDYRDNDKILTLLTAERGKITAGIRGVKRAGAKLKFAAQPFCFAEYVLTEKGGKYTVINASENESFYDLRMDIGKFYAASAVCEAAEALTFEGDECRDIFYETINALTNICNGDESEALLKFLLTALEKSGYAVNCDNCAECGVSLVGNDRVRFDMDAGTFTCIDCGQGALSSRVTYNELRKLSGKSYEEDYITADGEKRALRLLREYVSYKLNIAFKSLSEYIRLLN
jgi:DNA repair protein RecO (recombination protein O)